LISGIYGGSSCFDKINYELTLPIQGWNKTYFMPFKLPNLIFWFLVNNPFSNDFISFDKFTWEGKFNYCVNIAYFI
jgi:hypothetical protein